MVLRELRPAQVRAMHYAIPRSRIALFMQMRLGKSAVAIRWARHHKLERVLVVAPNDILEDWREELMRENVPSGDIFILNGSRLTKLATAQEIDSGWVIVNYEALRMTQKKGSRTRDTTGASILELPWSGIILDESTAIRTPGSQTTKTFLKYAGHIPFRAVLSGLPNPQSELDYFSQLAFLNGDFMGFHNFWIFRQRLFTQDQWDWRPKAGAKERIKAEVHKHAFILSRKDAGVGEHRVFEKRYVEMNPKQRLLYQQVEKDFAFGNLETQWATVKTVWMARIAGGFSPDRDNPQVLSNDKTKTLLNLLKGELANEPFVVWFRFNEELRHVSAALHKAGITHHTILGGGGSEGRVINHQHKTEFQTGKVRGILIQIKMGKYGWDLSRSSTAIYYSMSYDFEEIAQSRDRIVNVAKHESLLNISLVTRATVDVEVVETATEKDMTARLFNTKIKERLRAAWDIRHPRSVSRVLTRVMPMGGV